MIFEHNRFKVVSVLQHLYRHNLSEFVYTHPALPSGITNVEQAVNYIFEVLYPRVLSSVANVAALPAAGNTLGDYRVVQDDGDGKAASYRWSQYDGQAVPQWNKVMDVDWGLNNVLQELSDRTQELYPLKRGNTDYDLSTELPFTGDLAGQRLYGGLLANEHLILYANNGDAAGNSGYVQFGDDARPLVDNTFTLGTATYRFSDIRGVLATIGNLSIVTDQLSSTTGQVDFTDDNLTTTGNINGSTITASANLVVDDTVNQLTIGLGSITDTSGSISFGDENLLTTGTLASGVHTVSTTLVLGSGSITDTGGTISFGDEDLTTTGNITGNIGTYNQLDVDNIRIDLNTISSTLLNGNVNILANGTGVIDLQSPMTTLGQTVTGTMGITGQLDVDNLTLNGAAISSNTNVITFNSALLSDGDNTRDFGTAGNRWRTVYVGTSIHDGTNSFLSSELMDLRSSNYRDVARTLPAQAGDGLFYDGTNWLASVPDTEIDHSTISGLTTGDAGHTQFAMLAGRAGGQTLNGSTLTTETLTLINNAVDVDGIVLDIDGVKPNQDGVYDLGDGGARYDDLYMTGEGLGFRAQNTTEAAVGGLFGAGTPGRLFYTTDGEFVWADVGGTGRKLNNKYHNAIYTDVQLMAAIDVSATIDDARNCIWQLCDVAAGTEEVMAVQITKTATLVTITVDIPLPAGNYRLIGIQV